MTLHAGFPPSSAGNARVLLLGSLPGRLSLQRREYYAHPHNAFWRIMGELFGADPELPYARRLKILKASRIALWDVLAAAERPGSLDSAIVPASMRPNDIGRFLAAHPQIRLICFNGRKAAELYRRKVRPSVQARFPDMRYAVLPSTSPAHASRSFADKLEHWAILRTEV
jgi:double-stranded uracil-DNA glycosylase